ncbi:hypothetical protein F2Q69_00059224 [Brassica cretica]|uniref:Uncharacterized protein n=1 Tax=Brassica cretica TaxID=69181 RepID=A0A8S9RAZ8_BRACR|nr:hypothetical protein F2Q69_00059224 [Brassica cretica]
MAAITDVCNLKQFKSMWKIRVKILRLWKQYYAAAGLMIEMVLIDSNVRHLYSLITFLSQGSSKILINFSFNHSCVNYMDILDGTLNTDYLVDVLGQIVELTPIEVVSANAEFLLSLCAFRDELLLMVLWGNFATDVSEAIERGGDNAIVCVLRFGKIKVWKDERSVSNVYNISDVELSPFMPELETFLSVLLKEELSLAVVQPKQRGLNRSNIAKFRHLSPCGRNLSPRVPRVPRMRQPGSLPLSPTATSFKRTCSSGSKDHTTFSRRKNKDASKEGLRKSRDDDRCSTRSTKSRRPPDWRTTHQDSGSRGGEEKENRKTSYSSRRVLVQPNSTTSSSSGASSSNEHNKPSPHSSPRNNGTPVHQTLPGLINEIMSKGKRMTYEELCNAVLPHWPHLRKHNGERYAYSSHSQAVLDCLRNRHEWARLVDRGPKTNSGKKKRKLDAAEDEESDENESSKGGKKQLHHSQGEEFPKGKRKARKRRRLSLQGKGIKALLKKRNEQVSEEDEEGASSSDTSEESVFCEEEEEAPTASARQVSASSSEEAESTS